MAEMKWISVSDRLPISGNDKYLASVKEDGYNRLAFVVYLNGKWWDCFYNGFPCVTHWMPLPKLPKGE